MGSVYDNVVRVQDQDYDLMLQQASAWADFPLEVVDIQLRHGDEEQISLELAPDRTGTHTCATQHPFGENQARIRPVQEVVMGSAASAPSAVVIAHQTRQRVRSTTVRVIPRSSKHSASSSRKPIGHRSGSEHLLPLFRREETGKQFGHGMERDQDQFTYVALFHMGCQQRPCRPPVPLPDAGPDSTCSRTSPEPDHRAEKCCMDLPGIRP